MSSVIFDGHDLSELFDIGNPEITIANAMPDMRETSGRNGSIFVGTKYGNSTVKFAFAINGSPDERRDALSILGMWLNVDEPKKLVLPDTPDRFYMAVPKGAITLNRAIGAEHASLTFELVDPVAYGREVEFTVPSGGSVTFNVAGTFNAKPRITASAVRNSSALVWGLLLDDDGFIQVDTGSDSARTLSIDCDRRTCIVNDEASLITLDSDWLEFAPGTHTLEMEYGTGAATVRYYERWL